MGWPLSQDYNEAVQNPRTSFADPDLKAGEVVPGPLGLPLPRSGNFADVYQVRGADGRMWALKCFTRPAAQLRERYLAIDAHLRDARLPFAVGFQFLTEGVRIRGLWYPALKMEWVEGLQLNAFVRHSVGRPDHLRATLGLWVRLCKRLRDARIAHADLQHGNVLLVPGATADRLRLRLIDYDGMWVPALAGKPSGEAGHPNYQHPARLAEVAYSAEVDRFPHLVIGCALRALAVAGQPLWDRFDNGDNLLFKEADFADPARSKLYRALWELDDPTVTNLVALLVAAAGRPIADTPWLDEVLAGDRTVPVSDAVLVEAADRLGVERRTARKATRAGKLYVVPEEANQSTDYDDGQWVPRRSRRRSPVLPILLAGAAAMVTLGVMAVVAAVLILRWNRPPDDPGPPEPPVADGGDARPGRAGLVQTNWLHFPSGPRAPVTESLASGIDVAPPGSKIVRSFPVGGAAALGAWLRPDGIHAVLVGRTGIGVLNLATGQFKTTAQLDGDPVRAVVTPDGRSAVVASKDQSVRCVEVATGQTVWTKTFPGPVTALAVTPDGERVAASGAGVGYVEWGVGDGSEVRRHELLQATHLAFSPDGSHAVAANAEGVELWSLDAGTATPVGAGFAATAVAVSPGGTQALAVAVGREVRVWSFGDGKELPARPALIRQGATALAVTSDGTLLFGGPGGEVGYLGPDGTNALFAFGPDSGPVVSFAVPADRQHALVASERGNVLLTRLADLVRPDGPSKDGPAVGCLDFVRSTPIGSDVTRFAADAEGKRILAASPTHLRVYPTDTLTPGGPLQVPGGGIIAVGFGPDELLLVCHDDGNGPKTRTYDPGGGNAGPVFTPPPDGEPGRITRFVPVPNHTWVLATTAAAGDVLFDPATGLPVPDWPVPRPGDAVIATPSPDGRRIAYGTAGGPVRLWNVADQKAGPLLEASAGVAALAFTPDGSKLVGLWPHGRLRVWELGTDKVAEVDHDHPGPFTGLAAVDNRVVALRSPAGPLLLDLTTGKAIDTGDISPLSASALVIPARGWVVSRDRDGYLTAWKVNVDRAKRLPPSRPRRTPGR